VILSRRTKRTCQSKEWGGLREVAITVNMIPELFLDNNQFRLKNQNKKTYMAMQPFYQ